MNNGCLLSCLQSLCNVKKLVLNCAGLHSLPTTIGSLGKLEFLSLANNELKTLPVTLQCCRQLRVLDIRWNSFEYCIPPVLLRLSRLESLEHSKTGQLATYHDKSDGSYTWWKEVSMLLTISTVAMVTMAYTLCRVDTIVNCNKFSDL